MMMMMLLCSRNAEGEEYLRQRRLQLPFSCSSGEAILYNTGPTVDVSQFQFNKMFGSKDRKKDVAPGSLLDCFLRQDETIYTQTTDPSTPVDQLDPPLPVDQVFMDSHALVTISSDMWQEESAATTSEPVMFKKETKQSVMAVIDSLEKLTQNGDFDSILQVDDADLTEWENCLKRFHEEEDPQRSLESELDSVITDDIIDFIDSVFKEKEEQCLSSLPPSCLTEINFSAPELCEPTLFPAPAQDSTYSPVNGRYTHREAAVGGAVIGGQSLVKSTQMVSGNQKLSHQGPLLTQADNILPPLQQLQLQDIFSQSIELPELTVPNFSTDDDLPALQSFRQTSFRSASCSQSSSVQVQQPNQLLLHQNSAQTPALTGAGLMLQSAAPQPGAANILPPLIPSSTFTSSCMIPVQPAPHLQKHAAFETHNGSLQQWPQSQQLKQPLAGTMPNQQGTMPTFQSQNPHNQTFPSAGFWPGKNPILNQTEQGGPTAPHSSCMFEQQFSSGPAGEDVLSHCVPPEINVPNVPLGQYPPQSSYPFQWSHEPVDGLPTISQENPSIHPLTAASRVASAELSHNVQLNRDSNAQTQVNRSKSLNHTFLQEGCLLVFSWSPFLHILGEILASVVQDMYYI